MKLTAKTRMEKKDLYAHLHIVAGVSANRNEQHRDVAFTFRCAKQSYAEPGAVNGFPHLCFATKVPEMKFKTMK